MLQKIHIFQPPVIVINRDVPRASAQDFTRCVALSVPVTPSFAVHVPRSLDLICGYGCSSQEIFVYHVKPLRINIRVYPFKAPAVRPLIKLLEPIIKRTSMGVVLSTRAVN